MITDIRRKTLVTLITITTATNINIRLSSQKRSKENTKELKQTDKVTHKHTEKSRAQSERVAS